MINYFRNSHLLYEQCCKVRREKRREKEKIVFAHLLVKEKVAGIPS